MFISRFICWKHFECPTQACSSHTVLGQNQTKTKHWLALALLPSSLSRLLCKKCHAVPSASSAIQLSYRQPYFPDSELAEKSNRCAVPNPGRNPICLWGSGPTKVLLTSLCFSFLDYRSVTLKFTEFLWEF